MTPGFENAACAGVILAAVLLAVALVLSVWVGRSD